MKPAQKTIPTTSTKKQQAGKNSTGTRQSFSLTANGKSQTFGSRLEAQSAYIRGGHQGVIHED